MSLVQDLGQDQTCSCTFSQGLLRSFRKKNKKKENHHLVLVSSKTNASRTNATAPMLTDFKPHRSYMFKDTLERSWFLQYQRGLGPCLPSYLCHQKLQQHEPVLLPKQVSCWNTPTNDSDKVWKGRFICYTKMHYCIFPFKHISSIERTVKASKLLGTALCVHYLH